MSILEGIPVFLAVLETGSLQGASRHIGLARPTVRRRLEALEHELGVPLLTRGANGLEPTIAGDVFAAQARDILGTVGNLTRTTRAVGVSPHGTLRVGVPMGTPPEIVAEMTDAVGALWPNVRLELHCSNTPDDLKTSVDCRFSLELDAPSGGDVEVLELGVVREHLVASRSYLEAHPAIRSLAQLKEHRLFAWSAPDTRTPSHLPVVDGEPHEAEFAMATNDLRALWWLATHDRGIAFMPFEATMARTAPYGDDGLVTVLPDVVRRDRPRRLVTARAVARTPVVAAFLEHTRTVAAALFAEVDVDTTPHTRRRSRGR